MEATVMGLEFRVYRHLGCRDSWKRKWKLL